MPLSSHLDPLLDTVSAVTRTKKGAGRIALTANLRRSDWHVPAEAPDGRLVVRLNPSSAFSPLLDAAGENASLTDLSEILARAATDWARTCVIIGEQAAAAIRLSVVFGGIEVAGPGDAATTYSRPSDPSRANSGPAVAAVDAPNNATRGGAEPVESAGTVHIPAFAAPAIRHAFISSILRGAAAVCSMVRAAPQRDVIPVTGEDLAAMAADRMAEALYAPQPLLLYLVPISNRAPGDEVDLGELGRATMAYPPGAGVSALIRRGGRIAVC